MPRHTQPIELAKLKGADKVHPERYRKTIPKSKYPLGDVPDHLTDGAKTVWFELETYAIEGVLTGGDRMIMATLSELVAEFREDPRKMQANRIGQMISCLGRLGLTPADRQKLGTEKPPEDNPFNSF